MIIKFDNTVIDGEAVTSLSQSAKLFNNNFVLGSTLCRTVTLQVKKTAVASVPNTVIITDDSGNSLFVLYVDSVDMEDDSSYTFNLVDSMVKLNVAYDWSNLASKTAQDILDDICENILGSETFSLPSSISGTVIDYVKNTTAREFVSYCAEVLGGFAKIDEYGNLKIVAYLDNPANQGIANSTYETALETCKDILIGDEHRCDTISYKNIRTIGRLTVSANIEGIDRDTVNPILDSTDSVECNTDELFKHASWFEPVSVVGKVDAFKTYNGMTRVDVTEPIDRFTLYWEANGVSHTQTINVASGVCYAPEFSFDGTTYDFYDYHKKIDLRNLTWTLVEPLLPRQWRRFEATVSYGYDDDSGEHSALIKDGSSQYEDIFRFMTMERQPGLMPVPTDGFYWNVSGGVSKICCIDKSSIFETVEDFVSALQDDHVSIIYRSTDKTTITLSETPLMYFENGVTKFAVSPSVFVSSLRIFYYLAVSYNFLGDNNSTVVINENNLFFNGLTDEQIMDLLELINDRVNGLYFYSFKTTRCEINQSVLAGDIVRFGDQSGNVYPIIAQIDWQYNTLWYGGYETWLDNKFQDETSDYGLSSGSGSSINVYQEQNGTLMITE